MEKASGDPKEIDRMKRLTGYTAIFSEACRTGWHEPNCFSSLCRESHVGELCRSERQDATS